MEEGEAWLKGTPPKNSVQADLVKLRFALLRFTDVRFLQTEGKTRPSKNIGTRFITVVWDRARNIPEVCLYGEGLMSQSLK